MTVVRRATPLAASPRALLRGLRRLVPARPLPVRGGGHGAAPTCRRTLAHYPILAPGDRSPAVRTLQCAINDLGLGPVVVDGYYGPQTKAALTPVVNSFEGVPPHPYRITKTFWTMLYGAQLPDRELRLGDHGPAVRTLQLALRAWGLDVVVDGDFGSQTRDAVKTFQSAHNIDRDGPGRLRHPLHARRRRVLLTRRRQCPGGPWTTIAAVRWSEPHDARTPRRWPCSRPSPCSPGCWPPLPARQRPPAERPAAKPACQRTLASYPILEPGDRKAAVRTLQCSLNDVGRRPGRGRRLLRSADQGGGQGDHRRLRGHRRPAPLPASTTASGCCSSAGSCPDSDLARRRPRPGRDDAAARAAGRRRRRSWSTATSAPRPRRS